MNSRRIHLPPLSSTLPPIAGFTLTQYASSFTRLLVLGICLSFVCGVPLGDPNSTTFYTDTKGSPTTSPLVPGPPSTPNIPLTPPSKAAPTPGGDEGISSGGEKYDPPFHAPGLTDEELDETWYETPNTIKIGVLLPFSPANDTSYRRTYARVSLSVLRMAVRDVNEQQVVPGINISLVVRDSQRPLPETNVSGGAAAISATARLLAQDVGAVVGDIVSELTATEAILTSSIGVPQCSFSTCEKSFSGWCEKRNIEMMKVAIPLPDDPSHFSYFARGPIKAVKNSNARIHVLIASRPNQTPLLDAIRQNGLFDKDHVWLTSVDLSDSIARLQNPSDFNGLIMADALWDMPDLPAFDRFATNWRNLATKKYPDSGTSKLTWHETFAYTCVQVLTEGYKAGFPMQLCATKCWHGKRRQDLTLRFLGARTYDTPIGNFTVSKNGDPANVRATIVSFQNYTSVPNGVYVDGRLSITTIRFKGGPTDVPQDAPSWDELKPARDGPFGLTMLILCSLLMLAILCTTVIVLVNRDNIIIKSASPPFCILELFGLALTLSWVYMRGGVPSQGVCRVGLMVNVVGLTINLSALVVKNYRIYRIFNSVSVINHAVSNKYLLRVVATPVLILLIPAIIHCFVNNQLPVLVRTNDRDFWVECSANSPQYAWAVVIGIIPTTMILFGIYLAFKTRNVTRLWNEARSIAITIYLVTFFVIIIIIVQIFPDNLYEVTYHVTMVCVFVGSLLVYLILFYPKLRDLWLHKRGLHVAAGRDTVMMGGVIGAGPGTQGSIINNHTFSGPTRNGEKRIDTMGAGASSGSDGISIDSTEPHKNLNISDLVSSYPFGQLSGENSNTLTSPIHRPTNYGQSSLMHRGGGQRNSRGQDHESLEMDDLEVTEMKQLPPPQSSHSALQKGNVGNKSNRTGHNITAASNNEKLQKVVAGVPTPAMSGYDTFGRLSNLRTSRDVQPTDLHEILMASSSRPNDSGGGRYNGMLSVGATAPPLSSFKSVHRSSASSLESLVTSHRPGSGSLRSGMHSLRETRVVVPVQRQRWYIVQFLAQWRMSRIVFVPYSKLLIIVDLERETSESLILHSIEPGYFHKDDQIEPAYRDRSSTSETVTNPNNKIPETLDVINPTMLAGGIRSSLEAATQNQPRHQIEGIPAGVGTTRRRFADIVSLPCENSTPVSTSAGAPTGNDPAPLPETSAIGEAYASRFKRRLSRLNSVTHFPFRIGPDHESAEGTRESDDGTEGIEGIMSGYIVRAISIHNQCWKVQLPDQETMDRWIDIGQQIKDENWITRPINQGRRDGRGGSGRAMSRRQSSLDGGPSNLRPGGGSGMLPGTSDDSRYELGHRPKYGETTTIAFEQQNAQRPFRNKRKFRQEFRQSYRHWCEYQHSVASLNREFTFLEKASPNWILSPFQGPPFQATNICFRRHSTAPSVSLTSDIAPGTTTMSRRPECDPSPKADPKGLSRDKVNQVQEPSTHDLEQAGIREALAEINITYENGQHATYQGDHQPSLSAPSGHDHYRQRKSFNNMQCNFNRKQSLGGVFQTVHGDSTVRKSSYGGRETGTVLVS
ncbi:MAG: 7 transmembrane sweet-taste receptor of 3 GCPR-domain-containing protein [Benniella sp.]|nr:MAG: 7 transmembrane sweet-taste receptor of 3 GCPR-domain-containing protein [Benniella sp.]